MLSERLKETTKNSHLLLEKKVITQIKAIRSKQDYAALLASFYSFFGSLEVQITRVIDQEQLPDYPHRRKALALANDLEQLGTTLPDQAPETALPAINSHSQAMGALYVMEGSTLGGRIIRKIITQQLAEPVEDSLSFFDGYGSQTDQMWQLFKDTLDQPLTAPEETMVIEAADETFTRFRQWFDRQLS